MLVKLYSILNFLTFKKFQKFLIQLPLPNPIIFLKQPSFICRSPELAQEVIWPFLDETQYRWFVNFYEPWIFKTSVAAFLGGRSICCANQEEKKKIKNKKFHLVLKYLLIDSKKTYCFPVGVKFMNIHIIHCKKENQTSLLNH